MNCNDKGLRLLRQSSNEVLVTGQKGLGWSGEVLTTGHKGLGCSNEDVANVWWLFRQRSLSLSPFQTSHWKNGEGFVLFLIWGKKWVKLKICTHLGHALEMIFVVFTQNIEFES